jgi:hypothetical protein
MRAAKYESPKCGTTLVARRQRIQEDQAFANLRSRSDFGRSDMFVEVSSSAAERFWWIFRRAHRLYYGGSQQRYGIVHYSQPSNYTVSVFVHSWNGPQHFALT